MHQEEGFLIRIRHASIRNDDALLLSEMERETGGNVGGNTDYKLSLPTKGFVAFIAEHGDEPVGFAAAEVFKPKRARKGAVPSIRIWSLGVLEQYRRKRIASQLVDTLKALMHEEMCRQIVAEVLECSLPAQMLFKKQGFQWVETLKGATRKQESLYRMVYTPIPQNRVRKMLERAAGETT